MFSLEMSLRKAFKAFRWLLFLALLEGSLAFGCYTAMEFLLGTHLPIPIKAFFIVMEGMGMVLSAAGIWLLWLMIWNDQ